MSSALSTRLKLLMSLSMLLSLTACVDRNMSDLKSYVSEVKSRKAGHIEPLPEVKQIETFTYLAEDRRDPFDSLEDEEEVASQAIDDGIKPDFDRRKEELENFSLDSLRMVGTLDQKEIIWALMRTKERTIHRVKAGNFMGKNHGQITRITDSNVELTEIVPEIGGGYRERQASVALAE